MNSDASPAPPQPLDVGTASRRTELEPRAEALPSDLHLAKRTCGLCVPAVPVRPPCVCGLRSPGGHPGLSCSPPQCPLPLQSWPQAAESGGGPHHSGWATVKQRCRQKLCFTSSFQKSPGELRGDSGRDPEATATVTGPYIARAQKAAWSRMQGLLRSTGRRDQVRVEGPPHLLTTLPEDPRVN